MPSASPTLVIDDSTPLGQRVRTLLTQAGVPELRSGSARKGDRLLLVDAAPGQLQQALRAGTQHVIHVTQAAAAASEKPLVLVPSDAVREADGQSQLSLLRAQLYFEG